jgi:hypothetical protein
MSEDIEFSHRAQLCYEFDKGEQAKTIHSNFRLLVGTAPTRWKYEFSLDQQKLSVRVVGSPSGVDDSPSVGGTVGFGVLHF